jgi:hypothetical protein
MSFNSNGYGAPVRDAQPMSRTGLVASQNKFTNFNNMWNKNRGPGSSFDSYMNPDFGNSSSALNESSHPMNANPGGYDTPGYSAPNTGGFNFGGLAKSAMGGMEGLAAMYQAYNAHNMNKQAKKQARFEVASGNRNLANMAQDYNSSLMQRTRDGLALNGITDQANPEYKQRISAAQGRQVDGSAITA